MAPFMAYLGLKMVHDKEIYKTAIEHSSICCNIRYPRPGKEYLAYPLNLLINIWDQYEQEEKRVVIANITQMSSAMYL